MIPAELQYMEVIAVTANSGYDANTGEQGDEDAEKELPGTVTLLAAPEQAKVLAELEADGKLHLALVYRGDQANAAAFITAQESVLLELYPPAEEETDDGQTEPESTESEGSEPTDAPESEVE